MYEAEYSVKYSSRCPGGKSFTLEARFRLHKDVPPNERGNVRERIESLVKGKKIVTPLRDMGYVTKFAGTQEKGEAYYWKYIPDTQGKMTLYIKRTFLTQLGFGIGFDVEASTPFQVEPEEMLNPQKLEDYLLGRVFEESPKMAETA